MQVLKENQAIREGIKCSLQRGD